MKLYKNALFFSGFLSVLLLYLISVFILNKTLFSILLLLKAVVELVPLCFVFLFSFYNKKTIKGEPVIIYWLFFVVLTAVISVLIGFSGGGAFKYLLGDTVRFFISFIAFFAFYISWEPIVHNQNEKLDLFINFIFFYIVLSIIGKILLLSQGYTYGAGLNQFNLFPFVFFVLSMILIFGYAAIYNVGKGKVFLFLLVGIVLTILSFKREFWFLMAITALITFAYSFKRKSSYYFLVLFIISTLLFVFFNPSIVENVVYRFEYTFRGDKGLDSSSFERLAEIKGAISRFGEVPLVDYMIGYGAGAEFLPVNGYSMIKDSTGSEIGSYHHIHSMYMIILFRYGLLGLMVFLLPVFFVFYKLTTVYRSQIDTIYSTKAKVIYVAVCIQLFTMLISGVSSNSLYGNFFYGVWLAVAFLSYKLVSYENR
jgi:O-antigen ligase